MKHLHQFFKLGFILLCLQFSVVYAQNSVANTSAQTVQGTKNLQTTSVQSSVNSGFTPKIILEDNPERYLGLTLEALFTNFGLPVSLASIRGPEAWQDDVALEYVNAYSLYVFKDRVWQIRFKKGYAGSVHGVFIGDAETKLVSILGEPFFKTDGVFVYRLSDQGYPVRLRVQLQGGIVSDLFVFRSDF